MFLFFVCLSIFFCLDFICLFALKSFSLDIVCLPVLPVALSFCSSCGFVVVFLFISLGSSVLLVFHLSFCLKVLPSGYVCLSSSSSVQFFCLFSRLDLSVCLPIHPSRFVCLSSCSCLYFTKVFRSFSGDTSINRNDIRFVSYHLIAKALQESKGSFNPFKRRIISNFERCSATYDVIIFFRLMHKSPNPTKFVLRHQSNEY